ncbi:MAG: uroporphyrinogen-III synthase [Salibacteraceae bacterium]
MPKTIDVLGLSFIETKPLDFVLPKKFDWIFFTSPKGVHHFFDWVDDNAISNKKIGCIGQGTKQALEDRGVLVDFEGKEIVEKVAINFSEYIKSEDLVLFPIALESRLSIQGKLQENQVINLPIYQSSLKIEKLDFIPDIVIFTSPSNVKGFLQSGNSIGKNTKVIAIGETTASELKMNGLNSLTPPFPSEKELAKLTLSVL